MSLDAGELIAFLTGEMNIEGPIGPDTALFSSGLLDSVSMMSLIGFIEEKTRATLSPADVTLENFDSVERIVAYAASLD